MKIVEFPHWRPELVKFFVSFITNERWEIDQKVYEEAENIESVWEAEKESTQHLRASINGPNKPPKPNLKFCEQIKTIQPIGLINFILVCSAI